MLDLSCILERGGHGLRRDRARAYQLLERGLHICVHQLHVPDPDTMCRLAKMITSGLPGFPYDIKRGIDLYKRAFKVNPNLTHQMIELAHLYAEGRPGLAPDINASGQVVQTHPTETYTRGCLSTARRQRAVAFYKHAIKHDNSSDAVRKYARLLAKDTTNPEKPTQAVRMLEKLVEEQQDDKAVCDLASIFGHGARGVAADPARAFQLLEQAAHRHDACVLTLLSDMCRWGAKVDVNKPKAVEIYERLIETDMESDAFHSLGTLLLEGDGVERDVPRALKLYERAIEVDGNPDAMIELASALEDGRDGVEVDNKRALELYERAIREHGGSVGDESSCAHVARWRGRHPDG
ncbi:Sel1-repeat containing protein [Gracilaria domingensis]|nr:Sel1-repeat containing protein [Gracilaria domingensis]